MLDVSNIDSAGFNTWDLNYTLSAGTWTVELWHYHYSNGGDGYLIF